jgi:hypothetical protein
MQIMVRIPSLRCNGVRVVSLSLYPYVMDLMISSKKAYLKVSSDSEHRQRDIRPADEM